MVFEMNTLRKLYLSGLLLVLLPILVGVVLTGMVRYSWIAVDADAVNLIIWGVLMPTSCFGGGLTAISLYMANKNLNERD